MGKGSHRMLTSGSVMMQVALGVLVSLVALMLAARTMPFTDTSLNRMHLTCLAIQSLALFCTFPSPAFSRSLACRSEA
eukprot:685906-Rhodomonas_salina.3